METEDAVRRDAQAACCICRGVGWYWGWSHARCPVKLRCPCVDQQRDSKLASLKPETIIVSAEDFDALTRAINNPSEPNENFQALMRRKPIWET